MSPPPRHLAAVLAALGVVAVLSLLAADGNWARPAVVRYLEHTSKREVQLDDLQIRLDADWQPVVRLRGLRVANAPWATGNRPFIVAREANFTFEWATLFSRPRVMREMHLVDADIDLQRQADGLRNWRLTRPDDRGPGRMRIQRVRAERSHLTLAHRGLGLTFEARSAPLPKADGPHSLYAQRIHFRGHHGGAEWGGQADVGPVLSMVDTGERFVLRGEAQSGDTVLALHGEIADLMRVSAVDAQVQLQGGSLARLQPFLPRTRWPASRPYRFDGRLVREGSAWVAQAAQLRLGRSDLAGQARYTPARAQRSGRASLQATLTSELLRLEDLPSRPDRSGPSREPASESAGPASATRVLPQRELPLASLHRLDGRISLRAARFEAPKWPAALQVHATATLDQGHAKVELQQGQLGGGQWQGHFALDGRGSQAGGAHATLQLKARGVQLPQLWPQLARQADVQWPAVTGELKLTTRGPTLASWWRGLDGQIDLHVSGGSLPKKLDARLGLHAGRMLSALVSGDQPVPIRCGAVSLAFKGGVGRTRELVLETERTQVRGIGSVHLAEESWALVLTPPAHGSVLPASITARGSFRALKVELAQREPVPATAGGRCSKDPIRSG
jgi:uncharacterized protein involved in outer membrane biogenesis